MSTIRVLSIDDHRDRRLQRLRRTLALLAPDPGRARLAYHSSELLARIGGDRVALAWLDEYDPSGGAHAHVVVDLLRDRPRRAFDLLPLLEAWDRGVPGIVDLPDVRSSGVGGPASLAVVALGSDGRRAWFVVVDGAAPRNALSPALSDELAFRSGEIAGLLMHPEEGPPYFAGWNSLQDAPTTDRGVDTDRVATRFVVVRFLRSFVSDDLLPDPEILAEQATYLRGELARWEGEPEAAVWRRVIDAGTAGDLEVLLEAARELGDCAAAHGELAGAIEAHVIAYTLAAALAETRTAALIARDLGRAHRNAGDWDESESWYSAAVSLAQLLDDAGLEATALDGWANTLRVKGNLPRARLHLLRALDLADRSGDRFAIGTVRQSLMTLHTLMGRLDEALGHGWCAVEAFETRQGQVRALVAVAGVLLDHDQADLAEQAYAVALKYVEEPYFRLFALDGHAHAAALRGSRTEYETRIAIVDDADWRPGGPDFEGQVYLYRGRAWERLGDRDRARRCFSLAVEVAEAHRLSHTLFAAQDGLDRLRTDAYDEARHPPVPSLGADTALGAAGRLEETDRRLAGVSS